MTFRTFRLAAILPLAALASCAEEPADLPYGTVQQMMANHVQPTAEIYWNAVGSSSELVDGQPVFREWAPETDAEWQEVAQSMVTMREYADALASRAYAEGRGDDWIDFANGLRDVATRAEQVAQSKDPEAMFEVGGTIYNVCTACHQVYPPAEVPEGEEPVDMTPQGNG